MIKSIISKLLKRNQPKPTNSVFNTPVKFKTTEPDVRMDFDKWVKKYKVSSSFTLLEDSEWLHKVRKINHIKHVEEQPPVYLIKNIWG